MNYQVIIALLLAVSLLNLVLNLKSLKVPRRDARIAAPLPPVSIIVPARNEEKNIGACLDSLTKQDYANFEVIVVDDNSEDGTAAIITEHAVRDSRIHLVSGKPLPEGWAGKPHACFQGAQQATGEWLLFTDADTIHSSDMLRRTLSLAMEERVGLLSGFPRQMANSLSQKIAIPMMYFIILMWAPLWWLHHSPRPLASLAIGQFLLFPRRTYWSFGGHEAVKNRIMEDLWLGAEVARHGGRHLAVDLSEMVSCHMYDSLGAIWEGLTRALYGVSSLSTIGLAVLLVTGYLSLLAPFFWLVREIFTSSGLPVWGPVVLLQVALLYIMRGMVDRRFHESPLSTVLYPLGIAFIIAVVINGMARQITKAGVSWKKRVYD